MAADETSIKVSAATRDRLAQLAAEHRTTIRDLVEDLAQGTSTQGEYAELASPLGSAPSEETKAKARTLLERLGATAPNGTPPPGASSSGRRGGERVVACAVDTSPPDARRTWYSCSRPPVAHHGGAGTKRGISLGLSAGPSP
ncbi:hypothetical protein [Streptomyces sp. NPDC017673]|uniref:hypothetical protein n=1 Tax=unclassified Streptomyces TaxID=2593676 RepID=UPI0037B711F7